VQLVSNTGVSIVDGGAVHVGGGGGLGRIRVNTLTGSYRAPVGTVIRGALTTGTLRIR
jgi:hypothetical protein